MHFRFDVVIIGDSKSGHDLLDKLATKNPKLRIAFVSQTFKSTTTHDYSKVKYFRSEVEFVSYRHRLFHCFLANKDVLFSTHIVIASGVNYEPFMVNGEALPNVFNTTDDIPALAKDQAALVISSGQAQDAKLALDVAKNYKQVYFCTNEMELSKNITAANAKKMAKTENLTVVPNVSIQRFGLENRALKSVELSNYVEVGCSAIYVKTASKPATEFVPRKLIPKDPKGYFVVSEKAESELVPKCYAIGNCIAKYTKAMEQAVVEAILSDF